MKRVVITGLGIYSCIGKNKDEVRDSLFQGKSGIIYDPSRKEFGYRSALTGFVERPPIKGLLDRRARIMLPEEGEYAYMSTLEALMQAGLDEDFLASHDTMLESFLAMIVRHSRLLMQLTSYVKKRIRNW
jgi:3-oxoacyl-[acyl-carrier-protein] synthase-1